LLNQQVPHCVRNDSHWVDDSYFWGAAANYGARHAAAAWSSTPLT
jgi:hypothetical protein